MNDLSAVYRHSSGDLCKAYQPISFSSIIGQDTVVASIKTAAANKNTAHCYLFHGERGCGKTTMARVFSMAINCSNRVDDAEPCGKCPSCLSIIEGSNRDVREINAASHNGVNDIRDLESDMQTHSLFSPNKVYILDEAHMLTKEAQNALLKNAENMPNGVFLIMCSTEPNKLIKTLRDRSESYRFSLVDDEILFRHIRHVAALEGFDASDAIIKAIVSASDGRPRNALRLLQKVMNLHSGSASGNFDIDLAAVFDLYSEEEKNTIDLCKTLMKSYNHTWPDVVSVYTRIKANPETTSIIASGWFRKCLERAKTPVAADRFSKALALLIDVPTSVRPENALMLSIYKIYRIFDGKVK